ncbi:MAG: hypothetical protein P4M00_24910 [Azospirillaceae bacterium]|nr:hypothetical protein [Azospirillaceae bacterium]
MNAITESCVNRDSSIRDSAIKTTTFIHSNFRSGSTWLWNCFRKTKQAHAYYEPFNEILAHLDKNNVHEYDNGSWPSGHPTLNAPYYREYENLLNSGGGVLFYNCDMAVKNYFTSQHDAQQQLYIGNLIENAHAMGKSPVLGFCRSLGRVPWFRRYCPGVNVVTFRRPWNQWASYRRMTTAYDNSYFESFPFLVAVLAPNTSIYPDFLYDLFNVDPILLNNTDYNETIGNIFQSLDLGQRVRIFLRLYMLETLLSITHADEIVDMDRMSGDRRYRAATTERLRALSGLPDLSFDDCALPNYGFPTDPAMVASLEAAADFLDRYFAARSPNGAERQAIALIKTLLTNRAPGAEA